MRVNPNSGPSDVTGIPGRSAPQGPHLGQDELAVSGTDKLNAALQQTPELRADRVADAQRLVADPSYPSDAIVRSVAGVLAANIGGPTPPDNTT